MSIEKLIKTATVCLESAKKNSVYYGNFATSYKAVLRQLGYEELEYTTPGPVGEILMDLKKSADYNQSRYDSCCQEIEALEIVLQEAQKAVPCGIEEVEESTLGTKAHKAIVAEEFIHKGIATKLIWETSGGASLSECVKWYEAELALQK